MTYTTDQMSEGTDDLERRLRAMFSAATEEVTESPDLFARVLRSLDDQRARQRFRLRVSAGVVGAVALVAAVLLAATDFSRPSDASRWPMSWWILELVTTSVLVVLAVVLGPLIKRFGKAYAADVFRANPRTGKSYIVLTDVAYYLLFGAYILFTTTFELPSDWLSDSITGAQIKNEVSRIGGILLIIGVLHCANIVLLPVIGRLFTLNRRLDDGDTHHAAAPPRTGPSPDAADATLTGGRGGGTWILRIEPAPVDPVQVRPAAPEDT